MDINDRFERIQTVAAQYVHLPEGELERSVVRAWVEAGLIGQAPIRGDHLDYLREVRDYLLDRASSEVESVSVLTGMITADAVDWASQHGILADRYEYPIGILVAWITAGVLKKSKRDPEGKGRA